MTSPAKWLDGPFWTPPDRSGRGGSRIQTASRVRRSNIAMVDVAALIQRHSV